MVHQAFLGRGCRVSQKTLLNDKTQRNAQIFNKFSFWKKLYLLVQQQLYYQGGSRKIDIWEAGSKLEFCYQKYEVVDGGKIQKKFGRR